MTDEERATLGALVEAERKRRYRTKSAAYRAAEVNAATWSHIEAGVLVREDRLAAAVHTLWPSSGGDWRKVGTAMASDRPLIAYNDRALLDELEARLTERGVRGDGNAATTNRAAASAAMGTVGEEAEDVITSETPPPLEASPPQPPESQE